MGVSSPEMRWTAVSVPVKREAIAGRVHGAGEMASSNTYDSIARRSRLGVDTDLPP